MSVILWEVSLFSCSHNSGEWSVFGRLEGWMVHKRVSGMKWEARHVLMGRLVLGAVWWERGRKGRLARYACRIWHIPATPTRRCGPWSLQLGQGYRYGVSPSTLAPCHHHPTVLGAETENYYVKVRRTCWGVRKRKRSTLTYMHARLGY